MWTVLGENLRNEETNRGNKNKEIRHTSNEFVHF